MTDTKEDTNVTRCKTNFLRGVRGTRQVSSPGDVIPQGQ